MNLFSIIKKLYKENISATGIKVLKFKGLKSSFFAHEKSINKKEFHSSSYWEERYKNKGNSGAGSYNNLAEFKAKIINNFISKNNIETVIDFGCGDGNQLSLLEIPNYIGFDVSNTTLENCRNKFKNNSNYIFKHISEYANEQAELSLSIDVIFHLIEDNIFDNYMENLFSSSTKYVMIYSSNKNEEQSIHVKHRKFSDWITEHKPGWEMIEMIKNEYPYDENRPNETSFCDFYVYKNMNK